jgi:hypothetical protein
VFCQKCGAQNDDNAWKCVQCQEELQRAPIPGGPAERVPNYLVQSILVTVFCCLPFGIPAIVYSAQVNTKLQAGDVAGARESSRKAKMWGWISFGVGLVFLLAYALLIGAGSLAEM